MIYNNLNLVCNSSNAALVFTSMACNSAISRVGPSRDRISLIRETKSTSDKEFEINLGNDFSSLTWNISSNNPFSMSSITSHFLGISLLLASLSILIFSDFGISVLNCTNLSFSGLSGYSGIWDFFGIHFSYVSLNNKLCEMCIVTAISHSNRILFKETYVYLLLSIAAREPKVIEGDSSKIILNEEFDTIITSPPYFKNKEYENYKSYMEYKLKISAVFANIRKYHRGLAFININSHTKAPKLHIDFISIMEDLEYTFIQEIIWYRPNSTHSRSNKRLTDLKEYILIFSNIEDYKLYPELVLVPSKDSYGFRYGYFKPITNVWEINCISHNQFNNIPHPAMFPLKIPENCIEISQAKNVIDPFVGSGQTLLACKKLGVNGTGIEINPEYVKLARNRTVDKNKNLEVYF